MGFKSYGGLVDVNGDNTGRVSRLSGGVVSLLDASDQVPFVAYTDWGILIGAWDGTHSHGDTPGSLVKASQMEAHPSSGRRGEAASNLVTHTCNPNTWKTEAGRSGF